MENFFLAPSWASLPACKSINVVQASQPTLTQEVTGMRPIQAHTVRFNYVRIRIEEGKIIVLRDSKAKVTYAENSAQ